MAEAQTEIRNGFAYVVLAAVAIVKVTLVFPALGYSGFGYHRAANARLRIGSNAATHWAKHDNFAAESTLLLKTPRF